MEQGAQSKKWLWLVLVIVGLVIIGGVVWFLTKAGSANTDTAQTNSSKVYTPKHSDWAVYKSAKFGYNLSHPSDYVLAETGDKSINLTKDGKILVELYVASAGMVDSAVAMYTDDAKGYMTGGKAESVTIAGTTGKKVTGTFGKNGGNRMAFDGIKGSTTIFTLGNWTYYLNSYDNGEPEKLSIFEDLAADLVF